MCSLLVSPHVPVFGLVSNNDMSRGAGGSGGQGKVHLTAPWEEWRLTTCFYAEGQGEGAG